MKLKAYNETGVENIERHGILDNWFSQKLLSAEQLLRAKAVFPIPFYRPNIFIKVGLFIFTYIVISASFGFLSFFIFSTLLDSSAGLGIVSLGYAVALLASLEFFIQKNKLYRSGSDNALLYAALGAFFTFFLGISDFDWPVWVYCGLAVLLLLPAVFRYADPLVAIGVYVNWICVWYIWMTKFPLGKTMLPFVIMAVSAFMYWLVAYWKKHDKSVYYIDCQEVVLLFSSLTFYLGGNYYVVREGNTIINDLSASVQIEFAPLFYLFTALIPPVFVYVGSKRKDRNLLIVGLIAATLSVLTFLHYFSVIPGEWESTFIGGILVVAAVWLIRYFKTVKAGISSEADLTDNPRNFESFIIGQIAQPAVNQPDGVKLGGGNFGGGGAGNTF